MEIAKGCAIQRGWIRREGKSRLLDSVSALRKVHNTSRISMVGDEHYAVSGTGYRESDISDCEDSIKDVARMIMSYVLGEILQGGWEDNLDDHLDDFFAENIDRSSDHYIDD